MITLDIDKMAVMFWDAAGAEFSIWTMTRRAMDPYQIFDVWLVLVDAKDVIGEYRSSNSKLGLSF